MNYWYENSIHEGSYPQGPGFLFPNLKLREPLLLGVLIEGTA